MGIMSQTVALGHDWQFLMTDTALSLLSSLCPENFTAVHLTVVLREVIKEPGSILARLMRSGYTNLLQNSRETPRVGRERSVC